MDISFSDRQSQTIATAITTLATLVILLAIGVLGWLVAAFLARFSAVFLPLAVGAIGALVCKPYYDLLHARLKLPAAAAVIVVFLSGLLPIGAFLWFFGQILVTQLGQILANLPEYVAEMQARIAVQMPRIAELLRTTGLDEKLSAAAAGQQEAVMAGVQRLGAQAMSAGATALSGLSGLLGWAILPVYFAFFLTAEGMSFDSEQFLPFLKPETRQDAVYLLREFVTIIVAFFRGQLIIAFLQGVLYAVGFSIIGLKYGFVIGMMLGMLNVIPYLGSMLGLAVTIPVSLLQAGGGMGLMVAGLVVILIVQQIEGWVLTPKIMGDRTGLHFMVIIVAIFFWGSALGGILGMVMAIPLTAFLASLWRMLRDKYITAVV